MISLFFSLLPMVMIAFYFATNHKWKDVSWEIRRGTKCSSCKNDIYTKDEESEMWLTGKFHINSDNVTTCKSCRRDESIDVLFGQKSSLLLRFRNYLISEKSKKLLLYMMLLLFACIIIDVLFIFLGIKGFSIVSNSINSLYWCVMFIKRRYSSIRK